MKTRTEKILKALTILALLGGIGFSIECGSQIVSFVATFVNLDWAKHAYYRNQDLFNLREQSIALYVCAMTFIIGVSVSKAAVWYLVVDLLNKLKLTTPFSRTVTKKLEGISYILLGIWILSLLGTILLKSVSENTKLPLTNIIVVVDEYFFMAGIMYIISQVFRRGIELQEENQFTV